MKVKEERVQHQWDSAGESDIFRKAINISRALCSDTQLHIGRHNTITTREEANCSIAEHYTTLLLAFALVPSSRLGKTISLAWMNPI